MGLINFLKGVDIDKQRKQLFIDPFDKGSKTTVYNIGRNGSATILKVEDPKNVMLEKGTKTYTANGITYDIPTLEKKLGDTVDHFTFFVFDDTTIRDPDKTFIIANNSQLLHCKTYLIGPGFIYMPITQIDKVHLGLSTKQIHFTISPLGSWGKVSKLEIELQILLLRILYGGLEILFVLIMVALYYMVVNFICLLDFILMVEVNML